MTLLYQFSKIFAYLSVHDSVKSICQPEKAQLFMKISINVYPENREDFNNIVNKNLDLYTSNFSVAIKYTGCSAGVAHLPWEQRVAGSNPVIPNFDPVAQLDRASAF